MILMKRASSIASRHAAASLATARLILLPLTGPATAQQLTVDQMVADLAQFRAEFYQVDQAYSKEARARADSALAVLSKRLPEVTPAQFELTLAQIVALADNGHTMAFAGPRSRRYDRVGIRLTPFGEDFWVLRALPAHEDLLGAKVTAIDGRSIATIREAARTLAGGTPAWRDRHASYFIESPEQMHALGVAQSPGRATYVFETRDGRRVERRLEAEPAGDRMRANPDAWLYPEVVPPGWVAALTSERAPWSLVEGTKRFRWRDLPALDATIVDLRQNNDASDQSIRATTSAFADSIKAANRRHLILDMRLNGGGDLNTTRDFMRSLPNLVPGRIFVLMSPWTFSAAISSIGYLEQAAPERVTLVGEGPGDRLEFFAEGGPIVLRNSGAVILPARERHDYRTGCRGNSDCHGNVVRNPIAVPSLAPDIPAPWTIEAYLAGRDPGMEAVAAALRAAVP